jgi:hypothetical protein
MSDFEEQMEDLVYVPFPLFRPTHLHFWSWKMNSGRGSSKLIIRSNEPPIEPLDDLLLTHKTLMALLLQYEHLTKRISSIQCDEGGNQATVQGAVARMAATFLTKEMLKVQVCRPFFSISFLLLIVSPFHYPHTSYMPSDLSEDDWD